MTRSPSSSRRRAVVVAAAAGAVLAHGVVTAASADALRLPGPGATSRSVVSLTPKLVLSTRTKEARAATTRTSVAVPTIDAESAEVLRLVNVERAKVRCPAVRWEPKLATAARLHSQDMADRRYFSHTSLDGRSPWDRIRAQGYTQGSAENIAAGQRTPASVMTAWMNSSGHRANILNCSNLALGVGIGRGGPYGVYWTQDFGRS